MGVGVSAFCLSSPTPTLTPFVKVLSAEAVDKYVYFTVAFTLSHDRRRRRREVLLYISFFKSYVFPSKNNDFEEFATRKEQLQKRRVIYS